MLLNDDVLNEYKDDAPGLSQPSELPAPAAKTEDLVVVEAGQSEIDDSAALAELKVTDVVLKTTVDEEDQYDKMVDVSKHILAAESISRADVEALFAAMDSEEFAEGFTKDVGTLYGFTTLSTTTNLREAKIYLEKTLQDKKQSIDAATAEMIEKSTANSKIVVSELISTLKQLAEKSAAASVAASAAYVTARASKNALFYSSSIDGNGRKSSSLYDVRTVWLNSYQITELSHSFGEFLSFAKDYLEAATRVHRALEVSTSLSCQRELANLGSLENVVQQNWFGNRHDSDLPEPKRSYYENLELLSSNAITSLADLLVERLDLVATMLEKNESITLSGLSALDDQLIPTAVFAKQANLYIDLSMKMIEIFTVVLEEK